MDSNIMGKRICQAVHFHSGEMVWGQRTVAALKCKCCLLTRNDISAFDETVESIQRSKVHHWEKSRNQARGFPEITIPPVRQGNCKSLLCEEGWGALHQSCREDRLGMVSLYPRSSRLDLIGWCCKVCQQDADT